MTGLIIVLIVAVLLAGLLGLQTEPAESHEQKVGRIDALLPQTQCGQCGYEGCRPYAEALAAGKADINQCPPGGRNTIRQLAWLLDREVIPVNPQYGREGPKKVAFIDEEVCIGCVKCIQACPVDAIVGAPKQLHTVITEECTGCELCVEPCPVDCIDMLVYIHGGKRIAADLNIIPVPEKL